LVISKKEVKTQIGTLQIFTVILKKNHAGGAIAFPSYKLGDEFHDDNQISTITIHLKKWLEMYGDFMELKQGGMQ
jgi:hypothetical protein